MSKLIYIAVAFAALVIAKLMLTNVFFGSSLVFMLVVAVALWKKPLWAFFLLVLLTPFSRTVILDTRIGGMPGLKAFNFIGLFTLAIFMFRMKRRKVPQFLKFFMCGTILLFVISVFRALPNLEAINFALNDHLSDARFLLSNLVKPLLFFLPFILVICFDFGKDGTEFIIKTIQLSMLFLSVAVIYLYLFHIPDKFDFQYVRMGIGEYFDMHGNDLSGYYITTLPILFACFLSKKSLLSLVSLSVSLIVIALLYSRMAYLTTLMTLIMFLFFSKRKKILPALLFVLIIGLFFLPGTVKDRALTGFHDKNLDTIFAGRVDTLWLPLVEEALAEPQRLLIGNGNYAVVSTKVYTEGVILRVSHAHNMFLNELLEGGIISLLFYLICFFKMLKHFWKEHRRRMPGIQFDYIVAGFVTVLVYLISGLTDKFFSPHIVNAYLWVILALTYVLADKEDNSLNSDGIAL